MAQALAGHARPGVSAAESLADKEARLIAEIEARISENAWLRQNHETQLRQMEADLQRLTRQVRDTEKSRSDHAAMREADTHALKELRHRMRNIEMAHSALFTEAENLRKALALQKTANEKYLARIYELRAAQPNSPAAKSGDV